MRKGLVILLAVMLVLAAGCGGGTDTKVPDGDQEDILVEFECAVLEELVRSTINKMEGDLVSEDMWELYSLRIRDVEVTSLKGLEYAKNLMDLSIGYSTIPSLEPITALPELYYLFVSYSEIDQVGTFRYPEVLTRVSFIDTSLADIGFMEKMVNMENLTLSDTGISDITPLQNMSKLITLNLYGNHIQDIGPLAGKPALETITLQGNQVEDISPLADLFSLTDLTLSYNPVYNLKPLENLPNLESLRVYLNHDVKHLIFDHVDLLQRKGIQVDHHR